jgi:hypothetical protein
VASLSGQPFARVLLRPDQPWLRAPDAVDFAGGPVSVTVRYDGTQLAAPGLYVGTVWARPASDTLAGAAFGLTSTIVVPQPLDAPYRLRKYLRAGRSEHLFFDVPPGAGGLHLRIGVRDPDQHASLYVFEPGGRPFRGGSSLEIGGEFDREREVAVRGDDLVPGVYEAVIAAPPTAGVTFDLTAALPPVALALDESNATVTVRSDRAVTTRVQASVIGASRLTDVTASGDAAPRLTVRVPAWARELVLDVTLPERIWTRFTDFALSIWDSAGRLVAQQPLNYAVTRHQIAVDSLRNARLEVELFPAFALAGDTTRWRASVRVSFVADRALGPEASRSLRPEPDRPAALPLPALGAVALPEGFAPLIEATAQPEDGVPATRRGSVPGAGPASTR